jgi:hypothetical protein
MSERQGLGSIFTDDEWAVLTQVPTEAIMAVLLACRIDAVALLSSARIIVQVLIAEQQQGMTSPLVKLLLDSILKTDANPLNQSQEIFLLKKEFVILGQLHALNNEVEGRQIALDRCRYAASILSAKATAAQTEDFKRWLLSVASKVVDSVGEDICPRLGKNDTILSEQAALSELEKVL